MLRTNEIVNLDPNQISYMLVEEYKNAISYCDERDKHLALKEKIKYILRIIHKDHNDKFSSVLQWMKKQDLVDPEYLLHVKDLFSANQKILLLLDSAHTIDQFIAVINNVKTDDTSLIKKIRRIKHSPKKTHYIVKTMNRLNGTYKTTPKVYSVNKIVFRKAIKNTLPVLVEALQRPEDSCLELIVPALALVEKLSIDRTIIYLLQHNHLSFRIDLTIAVDVAYELLFEHFPDINRENIYKARNQILANFSMAVGLKFIDVRKSLHLSNSL